MVYLLAYLIGIQTLYTVVYTVFDGTLTQWCLSMLFNVLDIGRINLFSTFNRIQYDFDKSKGLKIFSIFLCSFTPSFYYEEMIIFLNILLDNRQTFSDFRWLQKIKNSSKVEFQVVINGFNQVWGLLVGQVPRRHIPQWGQNCNGG